MRKWKCSTARPCWVKRFKVEGVWTFTATDGQLTEGANSITVKATDDAGNSDTSGRTRSDHRYRRGGDHHNR
ncbi:Ig-like domain-containing protein [Vibrio gallaecicus]|uniref:Ig-like domain-containing protein n=1 Tax=Vibrio gallaecicus TaxID=552386 RepID=UPI0025B4011C|nr:Ig-like domain-containing protein [Vibrio gallaecicus]MDN3613995.1 Ig-like domain-containing protein [Vibrio gallaecicus]